MATIKKRSTKKGINYDVIYDFIDFDGVRKQKSKTCKTKKEATIFKLDVETKKVKENFVSPNNILFKDYMVEWINIYSKNNWSYSHYEGVSGYVRNHLNPYLGDMRIQEITPRHIESLMSTLRDKPVMNGKAGGSKRNLSSTTIRSIFFVVKIAFEKAVEWGMIESTPVLCATPKKNKPKYTIWSWIMMKDALDDIKHKQLHLAVHLSFMCSLRMGEALALTWDCVDFKNGELNICKTIRRSKKETIDFLPKDELIFEFPPVELD